MTSIRLYLPLESSVRMVANNLLGPDDKTGDSGVAKNPAFSRSHSSSVSIMQKKVFLVSIFAGTLLLKVSDQIIMLSANVPRE